MKVGRKKLPETCPYLAARQWIEMRTERNMSAEDVERAWRKRRHQAQRAGYSPSKRAPSQRNLAWLNSGVDNPFQAEHAFRVRLSMALERRTVRAEAAA